MLSDELLKILACPKCKGLLSYEREKDRLVCNYCRLIYRVQNDIPVMLIDEAEKF